MALAQVLALTFLNNAFGQCVLSQVQKNELEQVHTPVITVQKRDSHQVQGQPVLGKTLPQKWHTKKESEGEG